MFRNQIGKMVEREGKLIHLTHVHFPIKLRNSKQIPIILIIGFLFLIIIMQVNII